MLQKKLSRQLSSSLIPNSDEEIIEEAKKLLLVDDLDSEIRYEINKIMQTWIKKPWDQHKLEDTIRYYFQTLKEYNLIYDLAVELDVMQKEIVVRYSKIPSAEVMVITVKIV